MEFETIVSLALGLLVPGVVAFLKNVAWPKWQRVALAGAVSMAVAAGSLFVQGELNSLKDVAANTALVWAVATAFYKLHFGNTDLNLKLEAMVHGEDA